MIPACVAALPSSRLAGVQTITVHPSVNLVFVHVYIRVDFAQATHNNWVVFLHSGGKQPDRKVSFTLS